MRALTPCVVGALLFAPFSLAQTPATKIAAAAERSTVLQGIASAKIERVAPNRGALVVAPDPKLGANLKVFDAAGKEVAVTRANDGTLRAEVDPTRGYMVVAATAAARRPLTSDAVHFPARYVTVNAAGATALGGLFLRAASVPLTWSEAASAYATEVFVGYEFADGREAALAAPKTVVFFTEGAEAKIQADTVTVDRSGAAGYKRVALTTRQVDGETHFTARANAIDELKSSVSVRRELGALALSLPTRHLPAFGIGASELSVRLLGRDRQPFNASEPVTVQLSSQRVRQPATVTIPAGQSSVIADVRALGLGGDEIVATAGSLRAVLPVTMAFPTSALIAVLAGGVLGGVGRYLRNRRKSGALLFRRMLEGALVALIMVGAAWAGLVAVDLSAGVLGTPFGGFVLGALSGYVGCALLDRVTKKTFAALP